MAGGTVEVSGSVTIDHSAELASLYDVARRAKDNGNVDIASDHYNKILALDPRSWEANFYAVYYNAMKCKLEEIPDAAYDMIRCFKSVLDLVKESATDTTTQHNIVEAITNKVIDLASKFKNNSKSYYFKNYTKQNEQGKTEFSKSVATDMAKNLTFSAKMQYELGDQIAKMFDNEEFKDVIVKAWEYGVLLTADDTVGDIYFNANGDIKGPQKNIADSYISKIEELSPETEIEDKPSGPGGDYAMIAICIIVMIIFVVLLQQCPELADAVGYKK